MMATQAAEVVLPCENFEPTRRFFMEELGFRLDAIFPADDPAVAVLSGYGVRIRLDSRRRGDPGTLRLLGVTDIDPASNAAPNGTRIEYAALDPWPELPEVNQSLVVTRLADSPDFGAGRAGMLYRDLIPDRQGGRFIASHIRIPIGGPVPDFVHFHKVRFQMIYCHKGWVRVVYEDQGDPFVLHAGDCVLQPPEIRHKVLEASDGLEVVEIGCPAEHPTHIDHDLALPTGRVDSDRLFGTQKFVRHIAENAPWQKWIADGFEVRDLGIGDATRGLASARVIRNAGIGNGSVSFKYSGEFLFLFVLDGSLTMEIGGKRYEELREGDSVTLPAETNCAIAEMTEGLKLLEISLPAGVITPVQA